jgi:hypothetical protein
MPTTIPKFISNKQIMNFPSNNMHHRLFGLEMTNDLPTEERKELIDNLIDNHEIKAILVSDNDRDDNSKLESDRPLPNME